MAGGAIAQRNHRRASFWLVAVLSVVILDFFGWLAHVLLHKLAWAWRIHRVHHSDLVVDVTTVLRQHPGETIWRIAWRVLPVATLGISMVSMELHSSRWPASCACSW